MKSKYYYEFEVTTTDTLPSESRYGIDGKDFNTLISEKDGKNTYKVRRFQNGINYRMYVNLGLDKAETIVSLDQENRKLKEELERLRSTTKNEE